MAWGCTRVVHLAPALTEADGVLAGVEDSAMFPSRDGGQTWAELTGLRTHETAPQWAPGAGGLGAHTIIQDAANPGRLYTAISAAGVFRSDDDGASWRPMNQGLVSEGIAAPGAEVGHCVHRIAMHPSRPETLFMQKHWAAMRSDDGGANWCRISGNLAT